MKPEQLLEEIRNVNLAYLMLAQQMLRQDRAEALFRLGVTEEVGSVLESLSAAQLLRLAGTNQLLCRLRFDDEMVWSLLTSHSSDSAIGAGLHASILMAGQLAEAA